MDLTDAEYLEYEMQIKAIDIVTAAHGGYLMEDFWDYYIPEILRVKQYLLSGSSPLG